MAEKEPGLGLGYIIAAVFAVILAYCFIKGMEDQFCANFRAEVAQCKADHWRSAHCYEIFREILTDDCKK